MTVCVDTLICIVCPFGPTAGAERTRRSQPPLLSPPPPRTRAPPPSSPIISKSASGMLFVARPSFFPTHTVSPRR